MITLPPPYHICHPCRPVLLGRLQAKVQLLEQELARRQEKGQELGEQRRRVERLGVLVTRQQDKVEKMVISSRRQRSSFKVNFRVQSYYS